jgi:hypothetical protein
MVGASPCLLTVNSAPFEPALTFPAVVVHRSRSELLVKSKVCLDWVVPILAGQVSIACQKVLCFGLQCEILCIGLQSLNVWPETRVAAARPAAAYFK